MEKKAKKRKLRRRFNIENIRNISPIYCQLCQFPSRETRALTHLLHKGMGTIFFSYKKKTNTQNYYHTLSLYIILFSRQLYRAINQLSHTIKKIIQNFGLADIFS